MRRSRAIAHAEKNVQSSLDYAQSLLHARDLSEVMRLHGEYVQTQMCSLAGQASEMGQVMARRPWRLPSPRADKGIGCGAVPVGGFA
jgi:hypothetical protein